jgi:hypothetical protein
MLDAVTIAAARVALERDASPAPDHRPDDLGPVAGGSWIVVCHCGTQFVRLTLHGAEDAYRDHLAAVLEAPA